MGISQYLTYDKFLFYLLGLKFINSKSKNALFMTETTEQSEHEGEEGDVIYPI